jgi:hypothetical protein
MEAGEGTAVRVGERLVVDQHRGGHERAGKAAPPRLIGTGDQARAKAAVEGEQPARPG